MLSKPGEVYLFDSVYSDIDFEHRGLLILTGISDEDQKQYDTVMSKTDGFFKVRKNLIFGTARFNQRNQSEGELVEQYITALYHLVETWEYGDLRDEMLNYELVMGIRKSMKLHKQ